MMRCALTRAAVARPAVSILVAPRTSASIRFSSTSATETPSSSAPSSSTETPKTKPYTLGTTNANHYPVYIKSKSAGQSKFTLIKQIDGDRKALVNDLVEELKFPRDEVKINPTTNHIQVKGSHVAQIKTWLAGTFGARSEPNLRSKVAKAEDNGTKDGASSL